MCGLFYATSHSNRMGNKDFSLNYKLICIYFTYYVLQWKKKSRGKIMKYQSIDTELFSKSKEYIDTIVIPLNPVDFNDAFSQTVSSFEFMTLLTHELEKELKGRLFLALPLPYIKTSKTEEKLNLLSVWVDYYRGQGFKYIQFLTTDSKWTSIDEDGHVLWIPAIPIEKMPLDAIKTVISEQTKQLVDILAESWNQ